MKKPTKKKSMKKPMIDYKMKKPKKLMRGGLVSKRAPHAQ